MTRTSKWRGVYVIVPTPFHPDLSLDFEGLRRVVRFCLDCGVDGLVSPAVSSEQPYLADDERREVLRTIIEASGGKAAVIAGVTAPTRAIAVGLAREAEAMGADALLAMPPSAQRATEPEIREYYAAIDAAGGLPIFLQNFNGFGGTPLSPRLIADLLRELPDVRFVKEESEFPPATMTRIIELAGPALEGIMGGKACRQVIDEYARGSCGTMPACDVCDVHVALWRALEEGTMARAREIYRAAAPMVLFSAGYGPAVYKEVLRRRGVIECAAVRETGGHGLDRHARAELTAILEDLAPLMNPAWPVAPADC